VIFLTSNLVAVRLPKLIKVAWVIQPTDKRSRPGREGGTHGGGKRRGGNLPEFMNRLDKVVYSIPKARAAARSARFE